MCTHYQWWGCIKFALHSQLSHLVHVIDNISYLHNTVLHHIALFPTHPANASQSVMKIAGFKDLNMIAM